MQVILLRTLRIRDCKEKKQNRQKFSNTHTQTHTYTHTSNIKSFQVELGSDFLINGLCNERDA